MKNIAILFILLSLKCFGQTDSNSNLFLGNWIATAKYEKPNDPESLVKWNNQDDVDWLMAVELDSISWYMEGTLLNKMSYSINEQALHLPEGITFNLLEHAKTELKDIGGEFRVIFERVSSPKYDKTPSELFEVWEQYGTYSLNESGDTISYSIKGMQEDFSSTTMAFSENGGVYQFFDGSSEYYESVVKYRNDTLFYVKPYLVGSDTFYLENSHLPILQLDEISFVYKKPNLFGDMLHRYTKSFDRSKSSWSKSPKEILGLWKGTSDYRMEYGDTIRTTKPIKTSENSSSDDPFANILQLPGDSSPKLLDTTNNQEYEFLEDNKILYSWDGESKPETFEYEVDDMTLMIYKFPVRIQGNDKYLGIESYPIRLLDESQLAIQTSKDPKYNILAFRRIRADSVMRRKYIEGVFNNGAKNGIWGSYHENGKLKGITYYWQPGTPRSQLDFDLNGKYVYDPRNWPEDVKVNEDKNITAYSSSTIKLIIASFETGVIQRIEYYRDNLTLYSIFFDEKSQVLSKSWFDLDQRKIRTD